MSLPVFILPGAEADLAAIRAHLLCVRAERQNELCPGGEGSGRAEFEQAEGRVPRSRPTRLLKIRVWHEEVP